VEVVYERCAGLDAHKKSITACVLWALPKGKKKQEKRRFATFTQDLLAMADWLREMRRDACGDGIDWGLLETGVERLGGAI
jgi:hypothetical protein